MTSLHEIRLLRLGCYRDQLDGIVDSETLDKAIASGKVVEFEGKLYVKMPRGRTDTYAKEKGERKKQERKKDFVYKKTEKGDAYRDKWGRRT
jgi:hypothetical protein